MNKSAGLIALSISALRAGRYDEAATLLVSASDSGDCDSLLSEICEQQVSSCSSSAVDVDIRQLSTSLSDANLASKLSDPLFASFSTEDADDMEDEDGIALGVGDFLEDEEESEYDSETESLSSISITFKLY